MKQKDKDITATKNIVVSKKLLVFLKKNIKHRRRETSREQHKLKTQRVQDIAINQS